MSSMSRRERVRLSLSHQEADRVPMDLGSTLVTGLTLGAYRRLEEHFGLAPQDPPLLSVMFQVVRPDERIMKYFDVDFKPLFYRLPRKSKAKVLPGNYFINEWGITLHKPERGFYYDIVDNPLKHATVEDLDSYDWPNSLDPGRFEGLEEEARYLYEETDYALVGPGTEASLFEVSWGMRGFERFLMDLVLNPDFVHALLRRVMNIRKAMVGRYLELVGQYLDVVYVADDVAMQTGPIMSLETYRTMVKPYQEEYYRFIKERTEAKLFYHCCGSVTSLLDDFLEIGVDIINPIQVSAKGMDSKMLKERFGDRICFWGGIDTQRVLPYGDVEEVREEVQRRVADLAAGGGYVLAPVHNVQPDVPPENLCAMYDEARIVGDYSISI
jgi:uroporphyrinogen decarboxylase